MKKNLNLDNIFQKFKGLFSIGISDILGAAISSLFWLYMATILDVDAYGKIFYIFAIGNIVSNVSLIGAKNTLLVYVPKQIKLESALFLLVLILGSIASLIVFLIYSDSTVGIYTFGAVIFGLGATELLAKKFYTNYFLLMIIQKLSMVGLALGLYYLIGIPGIVLGVGLSFFAYLVIVVKEFKTTEIDFSLLKPRFGFMFNSFMQHLLATLWNQVDKLMIVPLMGFTLLGNYQLGIQFIAVFQLLPFIVLKFSLPHDASGNPNRNLKIIVVLISICFTVLIIFIAPIIIPIFFEKFNYIVDLIQILSLSLIPLSINTTYTSKFLGSEKSRIIMIGSLITVLAHIVGILILGEIFGIIGVAISYVLGMTILTVYYLIIDFKKLLSK